MPILSSPLASRSIARICATSRWWCCPTTTAVSLPVMPRPSCWVFRWGSLISAAGIFFARSAHYGQQPYSAQRTVTLAASTADTRDLLRAVRPATLEIFRAGVKFAKAGVLLSEFSRGERQPPLFPVPGIRNDHRLMQVIDALNQRKRHDVFLASQGIEQPWAMRRDMLSPAYTTRWEDLPSCR